MRALFLQNKIEAILAEKAEDNPQNGEIFNREAYLRDVENFEDVEVVVSGRNSVRTDRRRVRNNYTLTLTQ
jgi:hypothetical protein